MKEFIEKLIGRLEEYKDSHLIAHDSEQCKHCVEKGYKECERLDCVLCVWDKAEKIVNQLAEEYAKDIDVPTIDVSELFGENKIVSNADRIRSMTDEELAEFLINYNMKFGIEYEGWASCLAWLQSEAE